MSPNLLKLRLVHDFNLSTQETKAGGAMCMLEDACSTHCVPSQPGLCKDTASKNPSNKTLKLNRLRRWGKCCWKSTQQDAIWPFPSCHSRMWHLFHKENMVKGTILKKGAITTHQTSYLHLGPPISKNKFQTFLVGCMWQRSSCQSQFSPTM